MAKKRSNAARKKAQQKKNQNQLWYILGAIAIVAVIALIAFSGGGNDAQSGLAAEVNPATGKQMIDEGAFLLDVRNPDEWEMYHVDGATLIPLPELEARVNEVPRDRQIVVICNSGNRSKVGRDILLDAGFENVTSIAGGIQGWMSAGYDFVTGK